MQVKLLQAMAGVERGWMVGDIFDCVDADEAGRLIEAGIARALEAAPIETATAPAANKRGKE